MSSLLFIFFPLRSQFGSWCPFGSQSVKTVRLCGPKALQLTSTVNQCGPNKSFQIIPPLEGYLKSLSWKFSQCTVNRHPFVRRWFARWFSKDGGAGMLGITVAEGRVDLGWVNVRWDHGDGNSYRVGADGKYDLMVVPEGTRTVGNDCCRNSPDLLFLVTGTMV